jgi:ribonuclease P/MRP protein subunit RPP1
MINEKNIERAKQLIRKAKKPIIVKAQDDMFNRKILEYGKFDVLVGVEFGERRRDRLKQLDSGFNHVMAKIAAKNGVAIGIDLEEIRKLEGKEKALVLGRIRQNIKFCRKAGCRIKLFRVRDERDGIGFLISLGADTKQAKGAL